MERALTAPARFDPSTTDPFDMLLLAIAQTVCATALVASMETGRTVLARDSVRPMVVRQMVSTPAGSAERALDSVGAYHRAIALERTLALEWAAARDWSAKAEDNICGLRDLAQVSNPVVIDFQACLDATPEMKKIKAEKIDPKSPDGIRLTTEATNRVTQACESVQKANGYCSVWKSIKHKDGRAITDVSSQVTALF